MDREMHCATTHPRKTGRSFEELAFESKAPNFCGLVMSPSLWPRLSLPDHVTS
jgi:hypothetical protein